MKLRIINALVLVATVLLSASPANAKPCPSQRPNVLFILCDDIRWDALGYAGNPYVKTHNINRLARAGVEFKNMFKCFVAERRPTVAVDFSPRIDGGVRSASRSDA